MSSKQLRWREATFEDFGILRLDLLLCDIFRVGEVSNEVWLYLFPSKNAAVLGSSQLQMRLNNPPKKDYISIECA